MIGSDMLPSGPDWIPRRLVEMERQIRELQAGRRLEAATIGAGGLRVKGGAIRIQNADGTVEHARFDADGVFIGGTPLIVSGAISAFAGPASAIPSGWLLCDGAAVSRTTFAGLFGVIGTTWGVGDGSTTFNLPDLRDRVFMGAGVTFPLGTSGGAATHTHTNPATGTAGSHAHTNPTTANAGAHAHTNSATTSDGSHSHPSAGSHNHGGATGQTANLDTADGVNLSPHVDHTHPISSDGSHAHGAAGSHSHGVASTGGTADHAHTQGNTGTEAAHGHTIGDSGSGSSLPPYAAVLPIIRT